MEEESKKRWSFHTCDLCHYASKSAFVMHQHLDRHAILESNPHRFHCKSSTPELYKCELCDFDTDLEVIFGEHLRVSHGGKEVNGVLSRILECYKCKNCCFMTYSLLGLFRHECQDLKQERPSMDVKGSEERRFKCDKCPYKSKARFILKSHVLNKHANPEDINWYECVKCSFKFKHKSDLKNHVISKHANSEEINWFKCDQCSFKTKRKYNLKSHVSSQHANAEEINWYICKKCPFKAKHKSYLKRHVSHKHGNPEQINRYECYKCGFKTKQKSSLKSHILFKHSRPEEINWYKCDRCPFKAKQKSSLKYHILHKHSLPEEVIAINIPTTKECNGRHNSRRCRLNPSD